MILEILPYELHMKQSVFNSEIWCYGIYLIFKFATLIKSARWFYKYCHTRVTHETIRFQRCEIMLWHLLNYKKLRLWLNQLVDVRNIAVFLILFVRTLIISACLSAWTAAKGTLFLSLISCLSLCTRPLGFLEGELIY